MKKAKKIEEEINEILITLTDKVGFNHSNEHLDAFTLAEAGLIELFQKTRQEERKKLLERIENKIRQIEKDALGIGLEYQSSQIIHRLLADLEKLKEEIIRDMEKEIKEKIEDWEKEFDRQFCYRESIKGKMVLAGIVHFAENYKSFIRQLLKSEKEKLLSLTLEKIKNILKGYETRSGKKENIHKDLYAKLSEEISREN